MNYRNNIEVDKMITVEIAHIHKKLRQQLKSNRFKENDPTRCLEQAVGLFEKQTALRGESNKRALHEL